MGLDIYFTKKSSEQLGYFRKVNFLVAYFEEIGLDVRNQTPLEINESDVRVLLKRCEGVLKDHSTASRLLPTQDGFFFGNTEYDEDYFKDVEDVRDYINDTLLPAFKDLKSNEYIVFEIWY